MNQILFFISSTFIFYAPKFGIWDLSVLPLLFYFSTACTLATVNRFLNKWKHELLFLYAVLISSFISIYIGQIDRAHQDFFIILRLIKLIIIAYLIYIVAETHGMQSKTSRTFLMVLFLHPIVIIFQVIFPSFHQFCIELFQAKYRMAEFRFIGLSSDYTNSSALLGFIFGYTFWYYQKLYHPIAAILVSLLTFLGIITGFTYFVIALGSYLVISYFQKTVIIIKNLFFIFFVGILIILIIQYFDQWGPILHFIDKLTAFYELVNRGAAFEEGSIGTLVTYFYFPTDVITLLFGNGYSGGFRVDGIRYGTVGDSGVLNVFIYGVTGCSIIVLFHVYQVFRSQNVFKKSHRPNVYYSLFISTLLMYLLLSIKINIIFSRQFFTLVLFFYFLSIFNKNCHTQDRA